MLITEPAQQRLRDKSNPNADWSDAGPRLAPQAWPAFSPGFVVPAGGTVFTVGSCFARNIEEHVARLGFRVPTLEFSVPDAERTGGRGNAVLNKYTPAAIRQEFDWTRRVLEAGGTVTPEHVAALAFHCADGNQIDLQLGGFRPVSPDRLLARRQELFDAFRHAFTADCVVLTLGLVEVWVDETTGLAIQQAPVYTAFRRSLERFTFRRLDFASCRAEVQAAIDTVRAVNPAATFLITTSPVPLDRTFTDDDVITATMYGKSVLRAVCGEIVAANERVDYFPSYESVMLTRDWSVFQNDRRHVSDAFVGKIVQRLVDTYFREAPIDRRSAHAAYMASLAGEATDASALRSLWEATPQDVRAFVHYLNALTADLTAAVARYLEAGPKPTDVVRVARTAKRDLEDAATLLGAIVGGVEAAAAGVAVAAPLCRPVATVGAGAEAEGSHRGGHRGGFRRDPTMARRRGLRRVHRHGEAPRPPRRPVRSGPRTRAPHRLAGSAHADRGADGGFRSGRPRHRRRRARDRSRRRGRRGCCRRDRPSGEAGGPRRRRLAPHRRAGRRHRQPGRGCRSGRGRGPRSRLLPAVEDAGTGALAGGAADRGAGLGGGRRRALARQRGGGRPPRRRAAQAAQAWSHAGGTRCVGRRRHRRLSRAGPGRTGAGRSDSAPRPHPAFSPCGVRAPEVAADPRYMLVARAV